MDLSLRNGGHMNITSDQENTLRFLYQNSKLNRAMSKELGKPEGEYFWSGNLNSIHSVTEALGFKFDWMSSRTEDFNNYIYGNESRDEDEKTMKELMAYINMIKEVLDREYGKEVVFYHDGEWYSRDHSRNLSIEELREYLLQQTHRDIDDDY